MFFTFYYLGPSVTSCANTVYGFGDNTAGPIWRATLPEDQGLIGSYTNMTNAPFGDNLNSPIGYSLIGQTALIRTSMAVAGPVCGYNIINMIGFLLSALAMFGFIFAVTRKRWIALLAGYAVSFTPYYQMKIGGHPSYGYQAIFIGIIWLFYRLLKLKRKRDVAYLSIVFAIAVYFDPYFSLLAAITLGSLGLAWLIVYRKIITINFWKLNNKIKNIETIKQFRLLLLSLLLIVLLVLPLAFVFSSQAGQINSNVASSRGNVLFEAKACSNWPHEYLVPFVLNPVFEKVIGKDRYIGTINNLRDNFSCGIGEDSVGLSLTLVFITTVGFIIFLWEMLNKRRLGLDKRFGYNPKMVVVGMISLAVISIAIGFPPLIYHNIIPTPSFIILSITSTWRTLARVYVLVNISLVVLSSIVIAYFYQHFDLKKYYRLIAILFALICLGVMVEYQAFMPFSGNSLSTFNYNKDVPPAYTWLKNQNGIKTLAEYPLERSGGESNATAYYLTMQVVHKKKVFNSALSYSPQETLKSGLKNLSDPQTLPVLRALGVDAVVIHGYDKKQIEKIPNANVIYTATKPQFNISEFTPTVKNDDVAVLSLINVTPSTFVIELGEGFARNTTIINSVFDWQYEAMQGSIFNIQSNRGKMLNTATDVCFDIKMSVPTETAFLDPKVDGISSGTNPINGVYKTIKLNVKSTIELHNSTGHNMRVTKIGCNP